MLNAILHGSDTGTPLVIAHGLFGSARNWGAVARRLAAARRVIAVDMRNHGDSPRAAGMDYAAMAGDLAAVIAAHGGRADLLGHSMGGKAAMVLAVSEPARIGRLIVADVAPTAYAHSQIAYVEAMRAVDLDRVRRRGDADAMLAERVDDASVRAFLLQSLAIGGAGAHWKLDLEALGAGMPQIMGFPALEGAFEGPALFLSGARSDYVQAAHRPEMARLFPNAEHREIAEAGHWLHADEPKAVGAAIEEFLERTPPAR